MSGSCCCCKIRFGNATHMGLNDRCCRFLCLMRWHGHCNVLAAQRVADVIDSGYVHSGTLNTNALLAQLTGLWASATMGSRVVPIASWILGPRGYQEIHSEFEDSAWSLRPPWTPADPRGPPLYFLL